MFQKSWSSNKVLLNSFIAFWKPGHYKASKSSEDAIALLKEKLFKKNKLESLKAMLIRNYDWLTDQLSGVECRATSVAHYQLW